MYCEVWTCCSGTEHIRPRGACVPAKLTLSSSLSPPSLRPSPKPSPPSPRPIRRPLPPLVAPQIPHGSPTFAGRRRNCAPLRQASFQRHTQRARHLASRALMRDHILPDLGFTVYRIIQDSFLSFLSFFRLERLLCLFYLPFLLSHRTWDNTALFTRSSVLVYNHPRWPRPGERSIQNPIDAIDSFPYSFACRRRLKLSLRPVTFPFACCSQPFGRAATHSPLPRAFAFPSGLRTRLGSQGLPFELTQRGTLRQARWISEQCGSCPSVPLQIIITLASRRVRPH